MDWSYETEQSLVESHGLKIDEFDIKKVFLCL